MEKTILPCCNLHVKEIYYKLSRMCIYLYIIIYEKNWQAIFWLVIVAKARVDYKKSIADFPYPLLTIF